MFRKDYKPSLYDEEKKEYLEFIIGRTKTEEKNIFHVIRKI